MEDETLNVAMELIINGGNAKSSAFEAIEAAKQHKYDLASFKLKEADDFLVKGHNSQTSMLTKAAENAENPNYNEEVPLIMVHAQDHIMTAIMFRDIANEFVELYKKIDLK